MVHQIYCTHCTHGNSALERREGELARRMLGYSARAGSLDARELRRYYRQIERYLYYYLPRDTPAETKLRLTASSAPRRLVYYPSAGGLQVTAQVCYRQTDTEGRPGSYFAHVLFREEKDGPQGWSEQDCLKLWNAAGWVEEDSPDIPFLLPPLDSLDEVLAGRRPAVDDHVFLGFLSTPAEASFDDPAGVVPQRWRKADAGQRRRLFTDVLAAFLDGTGARREPLVLVVEPSLAALLFYGVVRMLPAGAIRQGISFSTFEPNADRASAALAATCFFDPAKADLRPEAYRSRGYALNTYSGRRTEGRRQALYAEMMVERLLERGWEAVDWRLATFQSAGATGLEDLDALAGVDRLVSALLDPRQTSLDESWRRSPMAARYLRQALARRLAELEDPRPALEAIVGRPAQLTILELLASEPEIPGTGSIVGYLLERLTGEQVAALLKIDAISTSTKIDVLARYVTAKAELPPGCEWLWSRGGKTGGESESLLVPLLLKLDANALARFYQNGAGEHSDDFLIALLDVCRRHPPARAALTQIVQAAEGKAILSLYGSLGPALFEDYPADEPALAARLRQMLGTLPERPSQFSRRLDLLLAGRHLLPDADQGVVTAWANLRKAIIDVGRLQSQRSGLLRQPP
ncbi:MAG: GAP1-N2 domain-containing protein, partial [Planctomycetota bacterium]